MEFSLENFDNLSEGEKIAMRYGADGKPLARVIEDSGTKSTDPDKIFDAWVTGENMRYTGEARGFLDEIENQEMKKISESSIDDKGNENLVLPNTENSVILNEGFEVAGLFGDFFKHLLDPERVKAASNVGELVEPLPDESVEGEEYTEDDPETMADYAVKNFGGIINRRLSGKIC